MMTVTIDRYDVSVAVGIALTIWGLWDLNPVLLLVAGGLGIIALSVIFGRNKYGHSDSDAGKRRT